MKQGLSLLTAACLLLYPFAAFAADYGSQSSQTQQGPPVAQPLVREGDFAIKLAAELDLGNPAEETGAEDVLTRAGIVPLNGWLSDYPMTPEIIGQLHSSIAKAASEGKLSMNSDEATRGLYALTNQMGLPTPAGPGSAAAEGREPPAAQSSPTVINNYYDEEGPPIVTYYPPPYYDAYLYDWVPYPVFWFGFWFPGFYISHSFTTVIVARDDDFDHFHRGRRGIVSNRVIDPVTRRVAVVDPSARTTTAGSRPITVLRTGNGTPFRTVNDLRRGYAASGVTNAGAGAAWRGSTAPNAGFRTPEARRSAESIYSRSLGNRRMINPPQSSMVRGNDDRRLVSPGGRERTYSAPSSMENHPFEPVVPRRAFQTLSPGQRQERGYSAPSRGNGWQRSVVPSGPSRSFDAPVMRGSGASSVIVRPSDDRGWGGRGGGVRPGAFCRGRC